MKKILLVLTIGALGLFGGDFEEGMKAFENKDYEKTLALFKKASKEGDNRASYNLGAIYQGSTIPTIKENSKEAFKWFELSAKQGNDMGQFTLGALYLKGEGTNMDKIKAYEWWLKSAKQGNMLSQMKLDQLCKDSPWACK